jgi:regulator of protease activity HflC (stomatin/prohibitin superfamily)
MLAKSYPQLREIVGELKQINLVDEVRAFFDERIKEKRDRRAIEGYIREQAFADGMAAGEAKGHAEREQLRQENERLKTNRFSAER